MYNGIGLTTVRGSGTNGYVQKNLSFVRSHKDTQVKYRTEEEIKKADAAAGSREPNRGIMDHERKRKLEVKCMELEEVLRDQVIWSLSMSWRPFLQIKTYRGLFAKKQIYTQDPCETCSDCKFLIFYLLIQNVNDFITTIRLYFLFVAPFILHIYSGSVKRLTIIQVIQKPRTFHILNQQIYTNAKTLEVDLPCKQ